MHILATFATLCCQTRWARNHSCTTQEHVSFFRTFSGTRQKPTGQNRTFSEISTFSTFSSNLTKCSKTVRKHKKHKFLVRTCSQKLFLVRACSRKYFVKCANVSKLCRTQIDNSAKCAKNRRAQNAQICSANYFPNAEIANSQICTVHNFVCASFSSVHKLFFCYKIFSVYVKKLLFSIKKNIRN